MRRVCLSFCPAVLTRRQSSKVPTTKTTTYRKERKKKVSSVCAISPPPPSTTFSLTFSVFEGERKGWEWGKKKEKDYLIPRCLRLPPFRSLLGWRKQKKWNTSRFLSGSTQDRKSPIWVLQKGTKKRKNNPFWRIRERRPPLNTHSHFAVLLKGGRKEEKKQKQDQEEEEGFSPADGEVRGGGAPLTPLSQKRRREGSCIM